MGTLLIIDFVSFDAQTPFFSLFLSLHKYVSQRNLFFQSYRIWHKLLPDALL